MQLSMSCANTMKNCCLADKTIVPFINGSNAVISNQWDNHQQNKTDHDKKYNHHPDMKHRLAFLSNMPIVESVLAARIKTNKTPEDHLIKNIQWDCQTISSHQV